MSNKDSKKIKCLGNSINTNEVFLHPITLELVLNKGPTKICPTELHYVNNKPYTVAPIDSKISDKDIQSYMAIPYLNLNTEQLLSIYNIDSIDSMMKWLDNNIDKPLQTINRILMVWIRLNFNELKKNNRILISIYKKINNKHKLNKQIDETIENKINNWFKNNNSDIFYLDLTEYLFN
jgi:hypothetical protein